MSSDSENVGGGGGGDQHGDALPLLLLSPIGAAPCRTRDWDMHTFNTHLVTTWAGKQSYVGSRTAEQCFFVFSEPENHHQAETEADAELGPGADATLWYRSRESIVRGQWPDSVHYVTVLFDWLVGWLLWACLHTYIEKCPIITVHERKSVFFLKKVRKILFQQIHFM